MGLHKNDLLKLTVSQIELYKTKRIENIYPEYTAAKLEGKIEGEKNKAVEIAQKMLQKKVDVAFIMETTGLNKETILMLEKSA